MSRKYRRKAAQLAQRRTPYAATRAWPWLAVARITGLIADGIFEPAGFAAPLGHKDIRLTLAALIGKAGVDRRQYLASSGHHDYSAASQDRIWCEKARFQGFNRDQ
jgi:hypothetical protein